MPRNGSGVYSHPFPDVVEGTTIESAVFNGNTSDVEQDLNTPRPIVAGGTGASNAHDAMIALSGEIAGQVVTNYDSFPFEAGSFYSAPGATTEPIPGGGFYTSGICHKASATSMVLEAYVYNQAGTNPVRKFTREKWVTWEPWKQAAMSLTDSDARYVNATGDTMTGNLVISPPSGPAAIQLYKAGTTTATIVAYSGVNARWSMDFGDASPESTGNAGSDFYLRRYSDAGTQLSLPIGINRATGKMTLAGDIVVSSTTASTTVSTGALTVAGGLGVAGQITGVHNIAQGGATWSQSSATTGEFHFGSSGTKYLGFDGTNYSFQGGNPLVVQSDITSYRTGAPTTGYYFFGNTGTKYFGYNGGQFTMLGGQLNLQEGMLQIGSGTGTAIIYLGNSGTKYLQFDGISTRLEAGQLLIGAAPANGGLDINSGANPSIRFFQAGVQYAAISDNGSSINVWSNAAQSTGMYIIHGGSAWTGISDARLPYKRTAKPLTVLDKVDEIYLYENIVNERPDLFVKAQELAKAFPHLVYPGKGPEATNADYVPTGGNDPNVWGVSYERAGVVALQGLKELKQLVTELRAEIASLKAGK